MEGGGHDNVSIIETKENEMNENLLLEIIRRMSELDESSLSVDPQSVEGQRRLEEINDELWRLESLIRPLQSSNH